jgi:hypothetical protein
MPKRIRDEYITSRLPGINKLFYEDAHHVYQSSIAKTTHRASWEIASYY